LSTRSREKDVGRRIAVGEDKVETIFWKTGNHGHLPNFEASGRAIAMNEITRIFSAIEQGDPRAADELLPLVYTELRRRAAQRLSREAPGQTLQATALVHEAYLRLVSGEDPGWNGRGHFFAAAAEAMRRILIERARRVQSLRRGGDRNRLDLDQADLAAPERSEDLLALDEALDQLAIKDARKAELIKLRYFAGLTMEQAAEILGISVATAHRDWNYARAWLHRSITGIPTSPQEP
jgi:RNA polymerase sigma factor (TIGR02999 family)